jgi:MFS family permease
MGTQRNLHFGIITVIVFTILGFLTMGYHPGAEDDEIYLAGVKAELHPAFYPHDAPFFQLQMKTTVFDGWMAAFISHTGMSVAWAEMFWQLASILALLLGAWWIVTQLFPEATARIGGLAMLSALLTLPVAGTALYIADQYLHPRCMASALILFASALILSGRRWWALPLLVVSFLLHPLMGALGISFCCFLAVGCSPALSARVAGLFRRSKAGSAAGVVLAIPFGWMLQPPSPIWLKAIGSRHWFRLFEWEWYEWLGALAPLVLFWFCARLARKQGLVKLERVALAVFWYGVFHQLFAMAILGPPSLIGLSALEPMRYLHLVYIFLVLIGGALAGKYLLQRRYWLWVLVLLAANGGMFFAQRDLFANTAHIELPGVHSSNQWLQAFDWIRQNTPPDAYFALDPRYLAAEGEDYHGFRALAERSQLADAIKDTSVVTKVPELGEIWLRQTQATEGWKHFQLADFERLKRDFGVNWVVVANPAQTGLDCRWANKDLSVCGIP